MTVIQCCDLSLGYEGKCVLSHLELSVQEGDYLAIVGENGAGKSTLLRGILGLIRPTGGHIHFHLPIASSPQYFDYLRHPCSHQTGSAQVYSLTPVMKNPP